MAEVPRTVDEYIAGFDVDIAQRLAAVRSAVREMVPQGEERISYRMPAIFQGGVVVYYAAFKRHIGVFPPVGDPALCEKVARYAGPKGNLQFPHHEPLPLALIAEVALARLTSNLAKASDGKLARRRAGKAEAGDENGLAPRRRLR